jgi:beta-glucosidase/6-phospho-beta-glucosidase/beta-galactosidase
LQTLLYAKDYPLLVSIETAQIHLNPNNLIKTKCSFKKNQLKRLFVGEVLMLKLEMHTVGLIALTTCLLIGLSEADEWEFPKDFKFGVATSAYQIEGGWDADGKSVSVWDRITHTTPNFVQDGSNGDIACDSYHKWEEDVTMLKDLGVHYYRFSLAWTRILPGGYTSTVNEAGVAYYNKLIDKLLENGIEPVVTLYHWDMPQKISTLGGVANNVWVDMFTNYARTAFERFGDRVKTWITFNEPNIICHYFHSVLGSLQPDYPNGVIEYLCTYNLLKAHAETYHIYDREFRHKQEGKVGITLNFEWSEPASDSPEDVAAAERRRQFDFGLFANPIINFDFPKVVVDRVAERSKLEDFPRSRLPQFTFAEKLNVKGTYDFLGLNHYTTWLVSDDEEPSLDQSGFYIDTKVARQQDPAWEKTAVDDNRVVPWGLRKALNWIKTTYGNPDIFITECGHSDLTASLNDDRRTNFYKTYLNATLEAILEDGVNVKAFMAWSLMDNFEWNKGYLVKFGIYRVNFTDPERPRTIKDSGTYYKEVISTRRI